MKYLFFLAVLIGIGIVANAQQSYKYVIIPTHFNDFGDGLNPYGLSSALQTKLAKHSIKATFEKEDVPEDYCEALTVNLVKISSMLTNKLKVEFRDCMNRVVWSEEGAGRSKEYYLGYAEAIDDAFEGLTELPVNKTKEDIAQREKPAIAAVVETEKTKETPLAPQPELPANMDSYKPVNPYYNSIYLVDLVETGGNEKELLILNGELMGYKNQQRIAMLIPSGLEGVFTVNWIKPEGTHVPGIAKLSGTKLEISLKTESQQEVIVLQKL